MASSNLITVILFGLLTVNLLALHSEAAQGNCCLSYSKKPLPRHLIAGYTIQTVKYRCNIDAIVFHTVKGKSVCANPAEHWVMNRIEWLKEKANQLVQ
nr:PREDICTED: C-C motif chemokine 20-like [Lepisosteus oculatus]